MSENQKPIQGYRKKPPLVYVAALLLMIAPIGNLLYSMASLGIDEWYLPSTISFWARYVSWTTWGLLIMLFSCGVALLFVRRWSWTFSLIAMGVIIVYDIIMWREFSMMGAWAAPLMILGTAAFAGALYFSEFRKPYLNPRLRWWETSPRYRVDLPIVLSKSDAPAVLVDISRTGMLIEWSDKKQIPSIEGLCNITLPNQSVLPAEIMRQAGNGYGLTFKNLNRSQKKAVQEFIQTLAEDPTKVSR